MVTLRALTLLAVFCNLAASVSAKGLSSTSDDFSLEDVLQLDSLQPDPRHVGHSKTGKFQGYLAKQKEFALAFPAKLKALGKAVLKFLKLAKKAAAKILASLPLSTVGTIMNPAEYLNSSAWRKISLYSLVNGSTLKNAGSLFTYPTEQYKELEALLNTAEFKLPEGLSDLEEELILGYDELVALAQNLFTAN